jgi:AcrR family transcriptional regulator
MPRDTTTDGHEPAKVLKSEERRREIVRAAFETIAEKGFEGLRMREIALRAGLNHATLHYYFKGKEALIGGVMDYIVGELSLGRDPDLRTEESSARQQLAAHFQALRRQAREQPAIFLVLTEIHARAARDPAIRAVMARNERAWKRFLTGILLKGIRRGEFKAALGAEAAAETVIALIRGVNFTYSGNARDMDRPLRQLSLWLEQG